MRIAELNDSDVSLLKSKFIEPKDKYPQDALHIFAGNGPAYIYIYIYIYMILLSSIQNQLNKQMQNIINQKSFILPKLRIY